MTMTKKIAELVIAGFMAYAAHTNHHAACLGRQPHNREVFGIVHELLGF